MRNVEKIEFTIKMVRFHKELAWVVIGQLLALCGGFVGIKILTNFMGPEEYGQLALGLTLSGLINLFLYGPVSQAAYRFFSAYREKNILGEYFSIFKRLNLLLIAILLLLAIPVTVIARMFCGVEWAMLVVAAASFGIVCGVNSLLISLQSAIRQRKVVALHQGIDSWLRLCLAVAALLLFKNSGYWALSGYVAGTLLTTISQVAFARKDLVIKGAWQQSLLKKEIQKNNLVEIYRYATPFAVFAVFAAISLYADRWILQDLLSVGHVGVYAAVYQIASAPVIFLVGVINQLMVPIIFERAGAMTDPLQAEASGRLFRRTVLISSGILTFIVVAVYFFGEPMIRAMTTPVFAEYKNLPWLITLGIALFNIGQLLTLKGLYFNKPRIYLWPKAVQAFSFLVFVCYLTKSYGMTGAGMGLCISSFLYVLSVVFVNKVLCRDAPCLCKQ